MESKVKEKKDCIDQIMEETDHLLKLSLKLEDEKLKVKVMTLLVSVKETLNGRESTQS